MAKRLIPECWGFAGKPLVDLWPDSPHWPRFLKFLEGEEAKPSGAYPPCQLEAMRHMVNWKTYLFFNLELLVLAIRRVVRL